MIDTFIDYSACVQKTEFTCTQQEIDQYYANNNINTSTLSENEILK